jgi:exosortase
LTDASNAGLRVAANDKLLAAGLLAVLGPVLIALGRMWWSSEHMSHGFLVPVVSGFVAASRTAELGALESSRDLRALAALGGGLALAFGGLLGSALTIAGLGVVISVVGLLWLRRGWPWVRALAFPLAYLLFMVPPPEEWHGPLVVWLQGWASEWSVATLYSLGVPVYLDGYVIQMAGGLQVEVAAACSGATSLYTLTAIGVLLAFLSLDRRRTRLALIALVIPAALVGNLARVVMTVLLCPVIGLERATTGWVHTALGLSIYVIAVSLLLAADAGLRRVEQRLAA